MPASLTTCESSQDHSACQRFRRETDLRNPVLNWLARTYDFVADEIGPSFAVADLVAARKSHTTRREEPLTSSLQLGLLSFLASPRSEKEVRDWSPTAWPLLRRSAIEPLLDNELISISPDTALWGAAPVPRAYTELVAIELKLRDWPKALRQSTLHHLYCHRAFVAMPADAVRPNWVVEARNHGVGLLAVDPMGAVTVRASCKKRAPIDADLSQMVEEKVYADELGIRQGEWIGGSPSGHKPS